MSIPHEQGIPMGGVGQAPLPYELTDAQNTVVGVAYDHVLTTLHDGVQALSGRLPADHPHFPGEALVISPNSYLSPADRGAGVWNVSLTGGFKAQVVASQVPGQEHPYFHVRVGDRSGEYARAGEADASTVASLLGFVATNTSADRKVRSIAEAHRANGPVQHLAALLRRAHHRKAS